MIGSAQGTANRPQQRTSEVKHMQSPYKGVDGRINLSQGDITHCVYTYNLIPNEYGMKVRPGYREWQVDVEDVSGQGVHTIIPFDSVENDLLTNKLFATTNEGIWDVTVAGDPPVQKLSFIENQASAGFGVYIHYTEENDTDAMFYSDSVNGLFEYDEVTDTWAQATGITGPTITDVRFVMQHKDRIWLVEEDANFAWYLPLNSKSGAATKFHFGDKYPHGGSTAGLFSWTIDAGDGSESFFVSVSKAGDVLVYRGSDPDTANDWTIVGTYYIGTVPDGPTFASVSGGELYILSEYGLNAMGDLLKGVNSAELFNAPDTTSPSARIARIIQRRLALTLNQQGWEVRRIPSESALLISGPQIGSTAPIQYIYRLTTAAWGFWRGVPMTSFETWEDNVVFGTQDNRICYMDVTVDDIPLNPPAGEVAGNDITFSVLSNFSDLGTPGLYKNVKMIRPDFISVAAPDVTCAARYDYDIEEVFQAIMAPVTSGASAWDVGAWDEAIWGSSFGKSFTEVQGSWGQGRYVAVGMVGQSRESTTFVGWDIVHNIGGPLL